VLSARDAGASQHTPEIDEHLYVDVFSVAAGFEGTQSPFRGQELLTE
jgi:hypothetical protein